METTERVVSYGEAKAGVIEVAVVSSQRPKEFAREVEVPTLTARGHNGTITSPCQSERSVSVPPHLLPFFSLVLILPVSIITSFNHLHNTVFCEVYSVWEATPLSGASEELHNGDQCQLRVAAGECAISYPE